MPDSDRAAARAASGLSTGLLLTLDGRRPCSPIRQGMRALLDQILEHLFVLQRIHRAPKALMPERNELVVLDQPLEGFFDQLLAIAQIVEDLRSER